MSTEETQHSNKEAQKTVVAFVVGLLVGGGLMWMFGGTPATHETNDTEPAATTNTAAEDAAEEEPSGATPADEVTEQPTATDTDEDSVPAATDPVAVSGEGAVSVVDQAAGSEVVLESAVYPMSEGWIGVRDYENGNLGALLGVVRFSEAQGLTPSTITLQRATEAGRTYAVVFYSDDGDREFSLATDAMVGGVQATFTAQ